LIDSVASCRFRDRRPWDAPRVLERRQRWTDEWWVSGFHFLKGNSTNKRTESTFAFSARAPLHHHQVNLGLDFEHLLKLGNGFGWRAWWKEVKIWLFKLIASCSSSHASYHLWIPCLSSRLIFTPGIISLLFFPSLRGGGLEFTP